MKKGRPQQPQLSEIMEGSPAQPQLSEIDIVGSPEQPQLSKIDIVGSPEQPQLSEIIKMVGSPAQLQLSEIMLGSPAKPQLLELVNASPLQPQLAPIAVSRGVQPNVNPEESAHQPQVTEAQIAANNEIRVQVQPNVEPSLQQPAESGGSFLRPPNHGSYMSINGLPANRPLLSEAQIVAEKFWAGRNHSYYRQLFLDAVRGDWKSAQSFIEHDPSALTARVTNDSQTAFHVAAICSKWEFFLKLLELVSPDSIAMRDKYGNTVLHYVAKGGSLKTAKALVQRKADLLQMDNHNGDLPLVHSIWGESKELVWYLTRMTRIESHSLPRILCHLIQSGFHDIALYFVQRHPGLALAKDRCEFSLLHWLACEPSHFFSGNNLGFWERWIYKFVRVEIKKSPTHSIRINMEDILESPEDFQALQSRSFAAQVFRWFQRLFWKAITQLAPSIKIVRDAKLKHECAVELVNLVFTQLSGMSFHQAFNFLQNPQSITGLAIEVGIEEIVRSLLQHFPDLIEVEAMPQRNLLQAAIEYRQEKIVNTIKEIFPTLPKTLCSNILESENTTLHLAGKLAPAFKLFSVSGAALQMQRELQWFKEVEKMTYPYIRELKNMNNDTAKDVFRIEHKELAEQGEKWMKATANSCMLVSTLIATVLFAAAFTLPGGNVNDKGIPIFLRTNAFTVFVISDALGLFSSLTSLLMFLAILTSRYAVEDFLKSLPKKLIIGLGSLFFAIAAMIIAFGAALTIVLSKRWNWVFVPITLMTVCPVAIFVMLQLPLFAQMVQSTYGSGMFHPSPSNLSLRKAFI